MTTLAEQTRNKNKNRKDPLLRASLNLKEIRLFGKLAARFVMVMGISTIGFVIRLRAGFFNPVATWRRVLIFISRI
jgi:hypothetical protein